MSSTLHQFSRQLATWAEAIIARGRSPFRRTELNPLLLTAEGEESPPLVVWINRDSFMAGGVLLIPPKETEESLKAGCRCADALGVRHFATWGMREITVWEKSAGTPSPLRSHPLEGSCEDPVSFRKALETLLEEFKLFSVLGAVPADELSPFYFANLARATLEGALPSLTVAARLAQGDGRLCRGQSPGRWARSKASLTLVRLIGLLAADRLPPAIHPEGLERAMTFALDTLPLETREFLLPQPNELPLPPEAAVRFHHLFRRLSQVHFGRNRERTAEVLVVLLTHLGRRLGGYPLPEGGVTRGALLINPDGLAPEAVGEIAPTPLLAITALLRDLKGQPLPAFRWTTCFDAGRASKPKAISGTLFDRTVPPPQERHELATRLRASWPNRRFHLPPRTPRWAWDLVQVMGVAADGARIDLHLPLGWLQCDFAPALLDLLREQFTLERLSEGTGELRLTFTKGVHPEVRTLFSGPAGERSLSWKQLREGPASLLVLALRLPLPLFPLLADGKLRPVQVGDFDAHGREIFLFSRSSLGGLLWSLCAGAPLPDRDALAESAFRVGWFVPTVDILQALRPIPCQGADFPSVALIDRELALWLRLPSEIPVLPKVSSPRLRNPSAPRRPSSEEIARVVFADGVPRFPEQYLYDYFRPELQRFALDGPLHPEEPFFGQFTLRDSQGNAFNVEGEETALALELASYSGRTSVDLPTDRRLTAAILERYLADLGTLRQVLLRQTHLHVANPRGAETLARRIWEAHALPPWARLEG